MKEEQNESNLCRVGNDLESEFYGNGSFIKICRINGEQSNSIYLRKILFYYLRESYLKAVQMIFYNEKTKSNVYTQPRIFGIHNTVEDKIIDEYEFTFSKDDKISKLEGTLDSNKIVSVTIQTTNGQYISVHPNIYNKAKITKTIDNSDIKIHIEDSNKFVIDFISEGKEFEGFNMGWNTKYINFIDIIYSKSLNKLERKLSLTDSSEHDITYYNQSFLPVNKSDLFGNCYSNTMIVDDYLRIQNICNNIDLMKIYSITVYYDKYINCIEIEYINKHTNEKYKLLHVGSESKINIYLNTL